MKREKFIEELREIIDRQKNPSDIEIDHSEADDLLLDYIDDEEIRKLFAEIKKWYA